MNLMFQKVHLSPKIKVLIYSRHQTWSLARDKLLPYTVALEDDKRQAYLKSLLNVLKTAHSQRFKSPETLFVAHKSRSYSSWFQTLLSIKITWWSCSNSAVGKSKKGGCLGTVYYHLQSQIQGNVLNILNATLTGKQNF